MNNDDLKKENKELKEQIENNHQGYKCNSCGLKMNFTFVLPFIKATGLCVDCFWRLEENLE